MSESKHDAREIGELLDVVSEKVPQMLRSLRDVIYSPEAATQIAKAVGGFYKELINAGMKPEEAMALTRDYMATLKMANNMMNPGGFGPGGKGDKE